jgi:hypothetical protein
MDYAQPKFLYCRYYTQKLIKIDRFGYIAVGMQLICAEDIRIILRSCQDHDGDAREIGIRLNLRQHLAAILIGQVQIQQNNVRLRGICESSPAEEKINSIGAIIHHVKPIGDFGNIQRLPGQLDIPRVILNQQDFNGTSAYEFHIHRDPHSRFAGEKWIYTGIKGGKSMYLDAGRKSMPRSKPKPGCAADATEISEQDKSVELNSLTFFVSVWRFHVGYLPTYGRED